MFKRIIKKIISFKCVFVKGKTTGAFIHPLTKISGYSKIHISKNVIIRTGSQIIIRDGIMILKDNSLINYNCNIYVKTGEFVLGRNSYFNNNCTIIVIGKLIIGKNVMVGPMCNILAGKHNYEKEGLDYIVQGDSDGEIYIEDNVWIGANSVILSGVKIGSGSIIGAGSVVTKCIGENEIWAGNPAKFIKNARGSNEKIKR